MATKNNQIQISSESLDSIIEAIDDGHFLLEEFFPDCADDQTQSQFTTTIESLSKALVMLMELKKENS